MLIESSTVTNCSPPAWTSRSVRPRHGRISASRPWCRCERLSLVATCTVSLQLASAAAVTLGVRGGRDEVAAERRRTRRPCRRASPGSRRPCRQPCSRGGSKPNSSRSLSRKRVRHLLPDAHRPVALHVAVPADRRGAGAGPADVAAQQQEVDDLADRRDRVAVLGQPHRPADDDAVGSRRTSETKSSISLAGQPARPLERPSSPAPASAATASSKPSQYCVDEVAVEDVAGARPRARAAPCSRRRTARGRR